MQFSPFLSVAFFFYVFSLSFFLFLVFVARNFDIIQGRAARLAKKYESLWVSLQYSLSFFAISHAFVAAVVAGKS